MLETYEWKNCPIPCTDKLGQMPISYILKTCTVFLLNVLKNFVLKSHLKAPNMQQLKKKERKKTNESNLHHDIKKCNLF